MLQLQRARKIAVGHGLHFVEYFRKVFSSGSGARTAVCSHGGRGVLCGGLNFQTGTKVFYSENFDAHYQHIKNSKYLEKFPFPTQSLHYNSHNNNLSHNIHPHSRISIKKNNFSFLLNRSTFFNFFKQFGKSKLCGSPSRSILGSVCVFFCRNCVRVRVMLERLVL